MSEQLVRSSIKSLRTAPQKLNLLASLIRGMKVSDALIQLTFSKKRVASDVKKCLLSAVANADNNYGLDVDNLFIKSVLVSKSIVMKRVRARAKGRRVKINKPFSKLGIILYKQ
ncbi:50S ribosomal protein L22 [Rickettsia endosymbiont of Cardiosporidium cionae]|uniref:50S ribosomal protein L22 n=1 Tax=Rickettsia endosymbiont of Cardiosporidium cionae TaxID=2777155 RepID=UPI001895D568|nr:50S ribosomal protein L22 [Rickettsia endosymbiont of Cardiosporidium cionae]KAF8818197.1 50S ribosomal protein L22 [Rickettsia endosymbiont of Cardiosporidium cionae]